MSKELKKTMSKEGMLTMSHNTGNTIKKKEIIKVNYTKFCGQKCNKQMIHSLEWFNGRFHLTEEKISKHTDSSKLYNRGRRKLIKKKMNRDSQACGTA